jgi:hypothetical protein
MNPRWAAAVLTAVAACCCCVPPALAQATTAAAIHPSFLPDRLGASTAVTLAFRFSGGQEGVPAPLSRMVVHLPAGLGISLRGVGTCPKARLQGRGPSGCPAAALLGRGHAVLEVHAGSQAIPEETTIWTFRGPNRGSHPTLEIFGQGDTPLDESTLSTAVLEPDAAPYGWKLTVSIPPIPTVVYEPDASFVSLSLTVGTSAPNPRAHVATGAIVVPRHCPTGGFPFAAGFTFADHATANTSATVACP